MFPAKSADLLVRNPRQQKSVLYECHTVNALHSTTKRKPLLMWMFKLNDEMTKKIYDFDVSPLHRRNIFMHFTEQGEKNTPSAVNARINFTKIFYFFSRIPYTSLLQSVGSLDNYTQWFKSSYLSETLHIIPLL